MIFLKAYILTKILDHALKECNKLLKELSLKLDSDSQQIEESLNIHLKKVKNWAREISFKETDSPKLITDVFIHLDLEVVPRRRRYTNETTENIPLEELISINNHIILLGQPGAGKTTSTKYLCYELMFGEQNEPNHDTGYNYPLLIKFRELDKKIKDSVIFDELANIFGISLSKAKSDEKDESNDEDSRLSYKEKLEKYLLRFIDSQNILLILDGFDEIPNTRTKDIALKEIRTLSNYLESSKLVVTSRSGDFNEHVQNTREFEIAPLKDKQIFDFATKWLGSQEEGKEFVDKVRNSPFSDTAIRPLNIAHLCAIYERVGDIPEKPKTVYNKVVNLLLEEWDQQRSVKRISKFSRFERDRKFEFLCELAFVLTIYFNKARFTRDELEQAYKQIYSGFDLDEQESLQVFEELETHTGLILKSGNDNYEFAHKSLQEYLTAEYIARLPIIPEDKDEILNLAEELAIAVTLSSDSSTYLYNLVKNIFLKKKHYLSTDYIVTFINRLLLEKPDFKYQLTFILSLLGLYTLYVESTGGPLQSKTIEEFELFIKEILEKNPKKRNRILNGYKHYEELFISKNSSERLDKYIARVNFENIGPKYLIFSPGLFGKNA